MKTLSLKQIRNAVVCLVAASSLAAGANTLRTVAQPTPHTLKIDTKVHTLLADDGQETHGGKGGHRTASFRQLA